MSQLTKKELQLMTAMKKNLTSSIIASVNWDQVAIEANYKDSRNANEHGWFLEIGRDGNVIQGSVSLDSETVQDGCTEIIPGYSQYLREWWEAVVTRNPNGRSLKASGFTKDMA